MTDEMASQLAIGFFPAAQRLRGGGQAGIDAEIMQEPGRIKPLQQIEVRFLRIFEFPRAKTHLGHAERLDLWTNDIARESDRFAEGRYLLAHWILTRDARILRSRVGVLRHPF